ncbi:hypothetical protein MPER_01140, partial [Moniliophthora perniciosa FA553]
GTGDEEEKHIPTADKVARVFSGKFERQLESDSAGSGTEEKEVEEELEEIDFADVGTFQASVDASNPNVFAQDARMEVEETFTGRFETRPTQPIAEMVAEMEGPLSSVSIESKSTPTDDVVMEAWTTIASIDIRGHDPEEPKPPPPPSAISDSGIGFTEVNTSANVRLWCAYGGSDASSAVRKLEGGTSSAKPEPAVSVAKAPSPAVASESAARPVFIASDAGQPARPKPLVSVMLTSPVTANTTQPVSICT